MSEMTTLARPYARACFEHAQQNKALALWSEILVNLSKALFLPEAKQFIANPSSSKTMQTELLMALFKGLKIEAEAESLQNFLQLLAENKRLPLIPAIQAEFELLRSEFEKSLTVELISFEEPSQKQKDALTQSLGKRLERQISLEIKIDKSILGGAIVRAGDLVIDGSVRGKLNKLSSQIAV